MKTLRTIFGIGIIVLSLITAFAQTHTAEKLFEEAKLLLFDKNWVKAQEKLDSFLEKYPESFLYSQALFYRAKCLQEQKGKEEQALKAFKKYLLRKDLSKSFSEESEISLIDLSFTLYEKGQKSYLKEIEGKLASSNKVIQYYAAFKLSYAKDKKAAEKALPALKDIIRKEKDRELKDRAKIALLRVDPRALEEFKNERYDKEVRILKIRIYEKGNQESKLSINIPWALADLALRAIPEKEKIQMQKEGYDLDKLIDELTSFKGNIIEITGEDSIIKIWIE